MTSYLVYITVAITACGINNGIGVLHASSNYGNSCLQMLTLFELYGTVFLFIWRGNCVPTPLFFSTRPLHFDEEKRLSTIRN